MKRTILYTIALLFFSFQFSRVFAQVPQKMSYQAIVRNANNNLMTNAMVGMQISIIQGTETGAAVYVETHTAKTNNNGLVTLAIGDGTAIKGTFDRIKWADGPFFVKTETDPSGGKNYTISGISQLMSVPFALYAVSSGSGTGLPGKSAYEVWKAQPGNSNKTEAQFLESLKGDKGDKGVQGLPGVAGAAGAVGTSGKSAYEIWKAQAGNSNKTEAQFLESLKGDKGVQGVQGLPGVAGAAGTSGKSAYEIWKAQAGNSNKTEAQFLESLKGVQGVQGLPGVAGAAGAAGTSGKSAYEIWKLQAGNASKTETQFLESLKGDKGVQGIQGVPGVAGERGKTGENGVNGIEGKSAYEVWKAQPGNGTKTPAEFVLAIKGEKGEKGEQGVSGQKGEKGEKGDPGTGSGGNGEKGDKGDKGDAGKSAYESWKSQQGNANKSEAEFVAALKGEKGEQGMSGQKGEKGEKGDPGTGSGGNGEKGEKGDPGIPGEKGITGDKGDPGEKGLNGKDGKSAYEIWKVKTGNENKTEEQFLESLKGSQGEAGSAGTTGKSAIEYWLSLPENSDKKEIDFWKAIKGEKGEKGDPGNGSGGNGEKGEKGDKGDPGAPGEKGTTGEKGMTGDKGDPGEKGLIGIDGRSAYDIWKSQKENSNKSEVEFLAALKGEKGETGAKGEKGDPGTGSGGNGEKGEKGDKGDAGTPGEKGLGGEKGEKGDKGDAGTPGEKGLGGEKGEKGDKGEAGTPGEKGLAGEKGEKGDKGDAGTPGEKGLAGEKGSVGEKGEKGDNGERGQQGSTGLSGERGIAGEKGEPGEKGDRGEPGQKGEPGEKGLDGKSVLNGVADPDGSAGKSGDFYINTGAQILFGPKGEDGKWPAGVSLKGVDAIGFDFKGSYLNLDAYKAVEGNVETLNKAYYDVTQKKSFVYNGTEWKMFAQDGTGGTGGGELNFNVDRNITRTALPGFGQNLGKGKTTAQFLEEFFFPRVAATAPVTSFGTSNTYPYNIWKNWPSFATNVNLNWSVTNKSKQDDSDDKDITAIKLLAEDKSVLATAVPDNNVITQSGTFTNVEFKNPTGSKTVDFSRTYTLEVKDAEPNTVTKTVTLTMSKAILLSYGTPSLNPGTLTYEFSNSDIPLTLNWSISPGDEIIKDIKVEGVSAGTTATSGSKQVIFKSPVNGGAMSQSFKLEVTGDISGTSSKNTAVINWLGKSYYGSITSAVSPCNGSFNITDEQVTALKSVALGATLKGSTGYDIDYSAAGQYTVFAYPDDSAVPVVEYFDPNANVWQQYPASQLKIIDRNLKNANGYSSKYKIVLVCVQYVDTKAKIRIK